MKTIRTLKVSPNAPDTNSVQLYKGTMKYFNKDTTIKIGGVKQATNVGDLATGAELATVVTKVNAILSALKVVDIMVKD